MCGIFFLTESRYVGSDQFAVLLDMSVAVVIWFPITDYSPLKHHSRQLELLGYSLDGSVVGSKDTTRQTQLAMHLHNILFS